MNSQDVRTSLDSSSSEDLDDISIDHELDIDISVTPRKPHFLDYDAVPPPGFEESSSSQQKSASLSSTIDDYPGETVKIDKKYERDGEISDYELAASGVTKKLLTTQRKLSQDNNRNTGARRKKHFLDENPIPPDYMVEKEREHRSLDRNFERQGECVNLKCERKHSLDRDARPRKMKEPNFTPSSFIDSDIGRPYRGTWPVDRPSDNTINYSSMPPENLANLGPKVECVYSLLSMLGSHDSVEMSKKFLELSRNTETCATLRRSGCIPLLVQMMHCDGDEGARKRAAMALHNVVHCHPDDKAGRREAKVLRLIEQIMDYCNFLKTLLMSGGEAIADDSDRHPLAAISSLMKISFDEEHRHAMCQLGALQAIASLVHLDHAVHGPKPEDQCCNSLRRYALMALTNLTFGDGNNKALLCANKEFMEALVSQLDSAPDDLLQVTASVLRNLSWRADNNMKTVLNEIGTVTALAKAAMKNKNENTLKAILSALWNLSAHCSTNKAEFCAVEGALAFLVDMLTYEGPSKTLKIIENAGGILRNVSSHIAVREDYRKILRQRNCLGILLQQLKSESLTVVSNACGTLWNLSARFPEDQKFLWDNGAVPMLRSLIHSKHKMISEGSSAALKNLLNFRPGALNQNSLDPIAKSMGLKELPTLNARKQRALEQELNHNLSETCDNLDVVTPPKEKKDFQMISDIDKNHQMGVRLTRSAIVSKSESRDSIISVKSDSIYEKLRRGHSAPPSHNADNKSNINKAVNMFNLRSNFVAPATGFDVEPDAEQPIDYSAKYNNEPPANHKVAEVKSVRKPDTRNYSVYQETDLDQPTDFSLRYAENQNESDVEEKASGGAGNEIILIMEDTVKCYQTEDTPYVISNAASDTDLRNPKQEESSIPRKRVPQKHESNNVYGSGTYTPEKPINYCEEGTPGYFSRYESLSSLDETSQNGTNVAAKVKPEVVEEEEVICLEKRIEDLTISNIEIKSPKIEKEKSPQVVSTPQTPASVGTTNQYGAAKTPAFINSAQETPLMFSRRSSMDSLASAEPITADDKSSVVSDFSRLASGVISPSELPDSPTQSMPQSPRRNSNVCPPFSSTHQTASAPKLIPQPRLRSVFEDDVNTFQVENTPAQFSCTTSLSNLSLDDEPKIATDSLSKEMVLLDQSPKNKLVLDDNVGKNEKAAESCTLSETEEATNDDILLATCINIGMNRGVTSTKQMKTVESIESNNTNNSVTNKEVNPIEDAVKQYCTEDTPALLSKMGSNSNLSALSMSTNRGDVVNLSDESSNASDGGTELLEQCIREGMQKSTSSKQNMRSPMQEQASNVTFPQKTLPNDPIAMLRRGGLPPYLPVRDEMNKFVVEDSPCSFSVASGLSNLTVGSGIAGPANMKKVAGKDLGINVKSTDSELNCEGRQITEDSLSSISIESEEDTNLLSQAIAAGCNKTKPSSHGKSMNPVLPTTSRKTINVGISQEVNDSLSSMDSSDSNDNQAKSLFEQCIRTGMNKQKKTEKPIIRSGISPKISSLPINSNAKTPLKLDRERQRERERKDEQLLRECINTGITKNVRTESQIKPPTRHVRQVLGPTEFNQRIVTGAVIVPQNLAPKNGETTSVAVLEQQQQLEIITSQGAPNIAPGVEMRESLDGTSNELRNQQTRLDHPQIENSPNTIGCELVKISYGSLNLSTEGMLDQSNEYPALKLSNIDFTEDSVNESSFEMEVSNEFLMEKDSSDMSLSQKAVHNKHKDPDLMLKSVERLTQELVSTAEYLRTNATNNSGSQDYDSNNTIFERKSGSNSNSNNTWNEDTCPNDVSFPSVSLTAPMIASLNDDETTLSDINASLIDPVADKGASTPPDEENLFNDNLSTNGSDFQILQEVDILEQCNSQLNSLETETDTLVNDEIDGASSSENKSSTSSGIQFKVGGEVQQRFNTNVNQFVSSGPILFDASSTMTTSTIIAMEANQLAQNLMQNMAESSMSLDLDNIRPPSCMDSLSISGCFDIPQSPQLSRVRKKSLPAGLMARRALGGGQIGNFSGSVESVNSSCNLDNIKPPSLMDELLDSMISVESISSEIIDNSLGINTNYITAFSDVDENTTTLQSCVDTLIPTDYDSNGTPIPSDFSSAESTPRKGRNGNSNAIVGVKRALTPKQKRRLIKDRYKTYTIAADFVLKENFDIEDTQNNSDYIEDIEVEHEEEPIKFSPRQRRHEDPSRYMTKVIEPATDVHIDDTTPSSVKRRSLDPDRFKTRTISYTENNDGVAKIMTPTEDYVEQESLTSTEDDSEEASSIRALTKQFKFIKPTADVQEDISRKATVPISPRIKSKILDEETRTTTESDYNSMECDQNSETESCDQNTYRADEENLPKEISKPKIIKPGDKDSGTEINYSEDCMTPPENVKAIRGRKKPAYVSPYKRPVVSTNNSRTASPKTQPGGPIFRANLATKTPSPDVKKVVATKHLSRNHTIVAKTHVLINKTNLTNKINVTKSGLAKPGFAAKQLGGAKRTLVSEKNLLNRKLNSESKSKDVPKETNMMPPSMERQGTFVKDEPSNSEVPVVSSLPSSPAKSSKLPTKANISSKTSTIPKSPAKTSSIPSKLRVPVQKSASMDTNTKLQQKASSLPIRPRTAGSGNLNELTKRKTFIGGVRKSPSVPTVPQRSSSNASLKPPSTLTCGIKTESPSTNPPSRSNSNLTTGKQNVQSVGSRIASIWKKTDDSKKATQTPTKSNIGKPPMGNSKLVRSSTFDNSPLDQQSGRIAQGKKNNTGVVLRRPKNTCSGENPASKRTSRAGSFINSENTYKTVAG